MRFREGDKGLRGVDNVSQMHAAQVPVRMDSSELLGNQGILVIEHRGQAYHLRVTRNDKLILTK